MLCCSADNKNTVSQQNENMKRAEGRKKAPAKALVTFLLTSSIEMTVQDIVV